MVNTADKPRRRSAALHVLLKAIDLHDFRLGSRQVGTHMNLVPYRCWPPGVDSNDLAPWMDRRSSLGMRLEEMVKDVQQSQHMFFITAVELRLSNIIDNHVTNFLAAML